MSDVADFIVAACVPLHKSHASGTLGRANRILAGHPEVAGDSIYTAAILGDEAAVRRSIEADVSSATRKAGPHDWDALTYLAFSRYLRLDPARSDGLVGSARALLDSGASANTGWWENKHQPRPEWEPVLYGAAGIAHHPELTRLLVERGADPNDNEVAYHSPEGYDNRALEILIGSGKLTEDSLAMMLVRKHDWHDGIGVGLLLDHGANPNYMTHWHWTPLQHAITRDNNLDIIKAVLDHGGDPAIPPAPMSPLSIAVRRGRGDVLEELKKRGFPTELHGVERLIAACAMNDIEAIETIRKNEPGLVDGLIAGGGKLLSEFAGVGNTEGVGHLLDLGIDVAERYNEGDGYFDIAESSTALHVAAWRGRHSTVKLLIQRGARVDTRDGAGRTPLALAVKACVDSYWSERRSPESVDALVNAGASAHGISLPSGYPEIDPLLMKAAQT